MLIGFNNDVDYRGTTFHIQTEDHGESDCRIETQLFYSGAIVDTVITSYEETIEGYEGKEAEERIRAQMKASHRSLYKKLMAGEYDEFAGLEPLDEPVEEVVEDAEGFTPSQDRVPAAAARIEEEGEDAIIEFQKDKAKHHVSLDKLKDQLSNMSPAEEDSDPQDDVAPTQVLGPSASSPGMAASPADGAQPAKPAQSAKLAKLAKAATSAPAAKPAAAASAVELTGTGARAWDGCLPCDEDLSLTGIVEEFLGL